MPELYPVEYAFYRYLDLWCRTAMTLLQLVSYTSWHLISHLKDSSDIFTFYTFAVPIIDEQLLWSYETIIPHSFEIIVRFHLYLIMMYVMKSIMRANKCLRFFKWWFVLASLWCRLCKYEIKYVHAQFYKAVYRLFLAIPTNIFCVCCHDSTTSVKCLDIRAATVQGFDKRFDPVWYI